MNRLAGCGIALGVFLIWRGASGDIPRSNFTGEPLISRTVYITCGVILVLLGIGFFVAAHWLIKSQT